MSARTLIVGIALLLAGCGGPPKPIPNGPPSDSTSNSTAVKHDPEMDAAIAKARATLDAFIARLQHPQRGEVFAVLGSFATPSGGREGLWLGDVRYRDGVFTGTVTTKPQRATEPKYGQEATIKRSEVDDWTIFRDGHSEGGTTIDLMMKRRAQPSG